MGATLKVVGVGGGGCNAIDSMIQKDLNSVEYIAVNTDAQVLKGSLASSTILVGSQITRGLGAGGNPEVGRKAVEEDREKIVEALSGSDMVFVTTGMGGGTGTGGAPVVASIAKSVGALVVGIVTKPFRWEGKQKMLNAENGINELKQYVDSLIVIPNERIINLYGKEISAFQAFDKPNEVLFEAVRGIADIINIRGLINVDFADVRAVMNQSGVAIMGCGNASGENRAINAAQQAISSPLLEGASIKGAKSILINITGSSNLTLQEITEGNNVIFEAAGEETHVIFGVVNKPEMNEYVSYTVIATGFNEQKRNVTIPGVENTTTKKVNKSVLKSGFDLRSYQDVDEKDITVPTIIRASKNNLEKEEDENIVQPSFNFDKFKKIPFEQQFKDGKNSDSNNQKEEDDDSSAFLRMIMD
ncbi:MAG: cell division protein FtsZ [Chlorobiaceae bacterium]|nr:cell division protein FtsZ [Chlorobiaceae bacterium]MBA4309678.1 cell division protein FtsZ [Chlorobiaceae bacterium]